MPTTLSAFWTTETSRLTTQLGNARAALITAGNEESSASADLALTGKQLQDARARVEEARKKLASIPMPADGDPLLLAMRQAMVDMRAALALQVEADTALRQQRAHRLALVDTVAALDKQLAATQLQAKTEDKATAQRVIWINAAKSAPLKDLPALAATALSSFATPAKSKVEGDFPANSGDADKDFLTRVRARRALAASVTARAQAVADDAVSTAKTWEEASTRESAKTAALQRDFQHKALALKKLFDAPARVKQAQEQLKALANRTVSPLTTAQDHELNTANATLAGIREDMLPLLKACDDAQNTLLAAEEAYAKTLLATLLAHPGKTEAELLISDTTLKAKKKDVDDAAIAVDDAESDPAFVAHLPELEAWFAAVPDALWEQLETLDLAIADLTTVKNMVPATLISNLASAEDALAVQLEAVREEQQFVATLTEALVVDQTTAAVEQELAVSRQQAAGRFVERV